MEAALAELEAALDHGFRRPELLVRALTHRSLANEQAALEPAAAGERTAAAGDIRAPRISWRRGVGPGGRRGAVSCAPRLAGGRTDPGSRAAGEPATHGRRSRGYWPWRPFALKPRRRPWRPSGARAPCSQIRMEAVIAALFLDGGLEPVRAFTHRWVMGEAADHLAEELRTGAALGNYKSALAGTSAGRSRGRTGLPA